MYKWASHLAVLFLLLMFVQLLGGRASPTALEQEGIVRGYAWLAQDVVLNGQSPMLGHVLAALPLCLLPDLKLPIGDPAWASKDAQAVGSLFLWQLNPNLDQILFLSRLPNALLALLLAAFVCRWARELYGPPASVLAVLLCAFDPNLLAHGRLAVPDLPLTLFMFVATYWLWKLVNRPTVSHLFAAGFFWGLALATRFSALLFGPVGILLLFLRALSVQPFQLPIRLPLVASVSGETTRGRLALLGACGLWIALIALLTVWVVYGFQVGELGGGQMLAPDYFSQLGNMTSPFHPDRAAHLMRGELYVGWRWSYLPVSFLLKTPLPFLALVLSAFWNVFVSKRRRESMFLIIPPVLYFVAGCLSQIGSGYRYLLPVLPFLCTHAGNVAVPVLQQLKGRGALARHFSTLGLFFALLGWYVFGTASLYPHYLAYFNEIAGGVENGWQSLAGEDLDRGQDLAGLKEWMARHGVEQVKLAYQGAADPSAYRISFEPLPGPMDTWETRHSFYPAEPAPGVYAISVNSLHGLNLPDPNTYAWFRRRMPMDKIGHSIFVYQVPQTGPVQAVACLSGLNLSDILLEDYRRLFGTNNVQFKWFDGDRAFIFPAQEPAILDYLIAQSDLVSLRDWGVSWNLGPVAALADRQNVPYSVVNVDLTAAQVATEILSQSASSQVWWSPAISFMPGDPAAHSERLAWPVNFGDQVEFLGYRIAKDEIQIGETWEIITWWRALRTDPAPLKLFVHLLDHQSNLLGGEDRLDVFTDGWQAGDVFAQVHRIILNEDVFPGTHQVELGWYDARTIQRLDVQVNGYAVADRVLLTPVEVVP